MHALGQYWDKERRRSVRCRIDIASDFVFFSDLIVPDFPRRRQGWVRDLSALGVCVDIAGIEAGEVEGLVRGVIKIAVDSQIPHRRESFAALARAVWVREKNAHESEAAPGYILGLEYIDITAKDSDAIKDFIIQFFLGKESR